MRSQTNLKQSEDGAWFHGNTSARTLTGTRDLSVFYRFITPLIIELPLLAGSSVLGRFAMNIKHIDSGAL